MRQFAWRPHDRIRAVLFGLGMMAAPLPVLGAPYCVETMSLPPQCMYFDPALCNTRANQLGGRCSANTAEVHPVPNIGHYCLMTRGQVSLCIYPDLAVCNAEAQHQGGVCVDSPNRPESPGPDPFRTTRPLTSGG
jgi:hypothetical protein